MKPTRLFVRAALAALCCWPLAAPAQQAGTTRLATTSDEAARHYFSDLPLLTQDGKAVRFYSDVLKDQVVLINFIYTHCADACPLAGRKLSQVQTLLGDAFGSGIRFVSISVDPANDTPQALRQYAERVDARPGWTLLTGDNSEAIVRKLGQFTAEVEDHSMLLIAGNVKTGHWLKMRPDSSPHVIAEQLRQLAAEGGRGRPGS
mgnify:CR=1 FL=1